MEKKITKIGNSAGIIVPNELLKQAELSIGDEIAIEYRDGEIVIKKNKKVELPKGISADFFDVLEETIKNYEQTIKGLVDR